MTTKLNKCLVAIIAVILLSGFLMLLILPRPALAQTGLNDPACEVRDTETAIKINFALPGITKEYAGAYLVKNLPCFIVGLYVYFAGVAGILATVMIMYGGVKYVVSYGNPQKIADAKDNIFSAIVGLVLALGAYTILSFINPNLVNLELAGVTDVAEVKVDLSKESYDWNGVVFCEEKIYVMCGQTWKPGELGSCSGVNCDYPNVCTGQTEQIQIEGEEKTIPTLSCQQFLPVIYSGKTYNATVKEGLVCGSIWLDSDTFSSDDLQFGLVCEGNKRCVIVPSEGVNLYSSQGDSVIGSFNKFYCK